jgi:outer membrane protein assembly factor BamB
MNPISQKANDNPRLASIYIEVNMHTMEQQMDIPLLRSILKRTFSFFSACIILLLLLATSAHADWPAYRHDAARSGVSQDAIAHPLSLRWLRQSQHIPKPAWPMPAEEKPRMHCDSAFHVVMDNERAYFGSSIDNGVYAINANNGAVQWTFYTQGPVRFAPSIYNGRLYVGCDDGYVYCLNCENGALVWKYRAGPSEEKVIGNGRMISLWPVRTSVLAEDGVAYFAAGVFPYEGIFVCALNAEDGSLIWRNDTIGDRAHDLDYGGISPHGYLVVSSDILYMPSGRSLPAAFDKRTGKFIFCCPPGGKQGGTWALLEDNRLIAGVDKSGSPTKLAYNPKTGKTQGTAYAWFPGLDMVVAKSTSYILDSGSIHAINRAGYRSAKKEYNTNSKEMTKQRSKLAELRKEIKAATGDKREDLNQQVNKIAGKLKKLAAREIELKQSPQLWRYDAGKTKLTCLILAGDCLLAGGEGSVIAINAASGKETWRADVEGTVSALAASDGQFIASTDNGHIYCFGKSRTNKANIVKRVKQSNPYREDMFTKAYGSAADTIIRDTQADKGYCLVLGCGTGKLAYELASRTKLKIIGLEADSAKLHIAREKMKAAGLLGSRVVIENWQLEDLPDYFANLIVSDEMLFSGKLPTQAEEIKRVLKPYGGIVCLGQPDSTHVTKTNTRVMRNWMSKLGYSKPIRTSNNGQWAMITRGALEGADGWTQQYGNPGNTGASRDELVKGPLGVLWFGEPGPQGMVERHGRPTAPVAIDGRVFIQGQEIVMAYDSYNGTRLWRREIPGAVRVRVDADGGNMTATSDALFIAAYDKCIRLDPATGDTLRTYSLPLSKDGKPRRWGYLSCVGNTLLGTSADPLETEYKMMWKQLVENKGWLSPEQMESSTTTKVTRHLRRYYTSMHSRHASAYPVADQKASQAFQRHSMNWGTMAQYPNWGPESKPEGALTKSIKVGDELFALNANTGEMLWRHQGQMIPNIGVAVGDGKVFLVQETESKEENNKALARRKEITDTGIYVESDESRIGDADRDVRRVVALDITNGKKIWEQPIDLTGCGGNKLGLSYSNGKLLAFGQFSNHDQKAFARGELRWRRITAINGENGKVVWSKPLNYRRRPLIVGEKIIIEPRACNLHTGEITTRSHPITGENVPFEFFRPGHSCGVISACPNMLFYRSWCAAFYDMEADNGLTLFGGIRPGCWMNLIPANGVLHFPEASSGCTCSYPLRGSVTLTRKTNRRVDNWSVFITHGMNTHSKHLHVNLGAPGDRRDAQGNLWFAYPRPKTHAQYPRTYGVKFNLAVRKSPDAEYFQRDYRGVDFESCERPWIFTSGCAGLLKCSLPLLDDRWIDGPRNYTVRLGFAAPIGDIKGQRVFDIKLQGKIVQRDFDIVKAAGKTSKPLIKEWHGIEVTNKLKIELVPKTSGQNGNSIICSIEAVIEQDSSNKPIAKRTENEPTTDILQTAKTHLAQKQYDLALEGYHAVLEADAPNDMKCEAMAGMMEIANPKSLSEISVYCTASESILRHYSDVDPKLRQAGLRVYNAIADNLATKDKKRAVRMLEHSMSLADDEETRQQAAQRLRGLGVDVKTSPRKK